MPNDRQRQLLAVLTARGPSTAYRLSFHPTLEERYTAKRVLQDDLDALVAEGAVVPCRSRCEESDAVEAFDVAGVDREGWRGRYQSKHP